MRPATQALVSQCDTPPHMHLSHFSDRSVKYMSHRGAHPQARASQWLSELDQSHCRQAGRGASVHDSGVNNSADAFSTQFMQF